MAGRRGGLRPICDRMVTRCRDVSRRPGGVQEHLPGLFLYLHRVPCSGHSHDCVEPMTGVIHSGFTKPLPAPNPYQPRSARKSAHPRHDLGRTSRKTTRPAASSGAVFGCRIGRECCKRSARPMSSRRTCLAGLRGCLGRDTPAVPPPASLQNRVCGIGGQVEGSRHAVSSDGVSGPQKQKKGQAAEAARSTGRSIKSAACHSPSEPSSVRSGTSGGPPTASRFGSAQSAT